MNAIAIFAESTAIAFADKKGNRHELSAEGALFKGGAALAALKSATMRAAGNKAANGKYRAAADILTAAYPSLAKDFDKIVGTPWANKSSMASFLGAIERAEPGKNGYTAKQLQARDFVRALRTIPALASETAAVTIEATLRRVA